MCGRFVSTQQPEALAAFFGATFEGEPLSTSHNVAPTNDVYGVVQGADDLRHIEVFQWGLVPSWAKDVKIGSKMINARAETVGEKPSFKPLLRRHRVILPMDGFYEWQATEQRAKTPMFIHRADGDLLAVAGLWTTWRDPAMGSEAPWLHSCTLITTAANATMAPVHDRMPVILERDDWATWLDRSVDDPAKLLHLLIPAADDVLTMHAVSTAVNNVRNKGSELVDPL